MLHKRLIGTILVRDDLAVQSFGFNRYLPIGHPRIIAEYLNRWGVDEICLLDITATPQGHGPNFDLVNDVARQCFVPLSYGGGVTDVEEVRALLRSGADKVVMTTSAFERPSLLADIGLRFGAQCAVAGLDVRKREGGGFEVVVRGRGTGQDPVTAAVKMQDQGAGEILIHCMDRDGMRSGMEDALFSAIAARITVPLIGLAGVGTPIHVASAYDAGCSAVGVGNVFNHSEHSVVLFKQVLKRQDHNLRSGVTFQYDEAPIGPDGRLRKRDEAYLDDLGVVKVHREVI